MLSQISEAIVIAFASAIYILKIGPLILLSCFCRLVCVLFLYYLRILDKCLFVNFNADDDMGLNDYEGLHVGLIDHDGELYKRWRNVLQEVAVEQNVSNLPGEDGFSRWRT